MQYKSETEKVATMATPYMPVPQLISTTDDPQIQRTRKILIIILGVCLGLSLVTLVSAIFGSGIPIDSEKAQRGPQIGQALLSIIFYGFGIFAAYRYSALSLRIFAWLCIIAAVLTGIAIVFFIFIAIVALIGTANVDSQHGKGHLVGATLAILFATGLFIAALILSVIIIKLAFKLARFIDASKNLVVQEC